MFQCPDTTCLDATNGTKIGPPSSIASGRLNPRQRMVRFPVGTETTKAYFRTTLVFRTYFLNTCPKKRTAYVPRLPFSFGSWLLESCGLGGLHVGRFATSPLPFRGSPHGDKHGVGYLNPAFRGSPMKKDKIGGERSIWVHHPCLLRVPILGKGQYGYITLALSGSHSVERSIWVYLPYQIIHGREKST